MQTYTLDKRYADVETRVVHDWAYRGDMDTFSHPNLTLSPTVVKKLRTDGYELSFEEVAQL